MKKIIKKHIKYNHNHNKFIQPIGVVLHSTANPGASAMNHYKYLNSGNKGHSAHCFIDWDNIIEMYGVSPNKTERGWHAGKTANDSYIGVEMCEPKRDDPNRVQKFEVTWETTVDYVAYLLLEIIGNNAVTDTTLMSHDMVSKKWNESTHTDPIPFFEKYGRTFKEFQKCVQDRINKITTVEDPWEQELGEKSIENLANKGYIDSPELWKDKDLKALPTPLWLFFVLMDRISNKK